MEAPNELRCRTSDGKTWRCQGWRIHGKPYCQKHYLKCIEKREKDKRLRNYRVGQKRSVNDSTSCSVVNAGGKSRLFSWGKRENRSRGREEEAAASEEENERANVVKNGKRSGEKRKIFETYWGSDEEWVEGRRNDFKSKKAERNEESGIPAKAERFNAVKRVKRSGRILLDEKKKKILRYEGSEEEERHLLVKRFQRHYEIGLGRENRKQIERNEESEDGDYWFREIDSAENSDGVKLGKEKKRVLINIESDEEEEMWHYVLKSGEMNEMSDGEEGERDNAEERLKRYGKPELGRKKNKLENSEETETEDEEQKTIRELISAKTRRRLKLGQKNRKVGRNNNLIVDEGMRGSTVKGGQRSYLVELRERKKNDLGAMRDEEERQNANVEKGSRLYTERRKEKVERYEVSANEDEERSVVKCVEWIDVGDDEDERDEAGHLVETSDEIGFGKTREKLLRTGVCDEEEEEDGGNLMEKDAADVLKMLRTTRLWT